MATSKITITLADEHVVAVRRLVGAGKAASVSGFIQHAVDIALHDAAGWQAMLEQALLESGGPLTKNEVAWADRMLAGGRARRRRKGRAA